MIASLQRLLNIRPEEARPVLVLAAYYFFITATAIAGRSVSNALFFSRVDNADSIFPFMLITVTLTGVLAMSLYTRLAKRTSLVRLLIITGLFFALVLGVFRLLVSQAWTPYALFVFMEVVNIVMFFQFYIFAGTIFDTRQAKRIFGLLGVGGAVASILSGLALRPFTNAFGPEAVILLTMGFVLLWVWMIWLARPFMRPAAAPDSATPAQEGAASGRLDGYLKTMAIVIAATILVATIVEYQFKVISTRGFADASEMTAFFGSFFALVGFCQIILRLFVVGNLLSRFGILTGLLLLPIGLAISSVAVLIDPVLITAVALKAVDQVLRYTLNETSMELLWVPISPQRKLAVKPIINGTIPTVLQGVAGLMIFFIVSSFEVRALSIVVLVIIAIWIPMTFRLRRGYLQELMKSIQTHELALQDLTIDTADAAIVQLIDRSLNSGSEVEQAFTLSLIEDFSLTPWASTLNHLFQTSENFFIRQKILDMAGGYPEIIPDAALMAIIQDEQADLIDEAICAAGQRRLMEVLSVLETYLDPHHHAAAEIQVAAAQAVLTMNAGPIEQAQDMLRQLMESTDPNASALALRTLSQLPTEVASAVVHESTVREMLASRSTRARRFILEMVVNPGYWAREKPADNETILSIALNLEKPATRAVAMQALHNYPDDHVIEVLTTILRDKGSPTDLKTGVMQALCHYPTLHAAEQIINQMDVHHLEAYAEAVRTLLHIARQQPLSDELQTRLNDELLQIARMIYRDYHLLAMFGPAEPLLTEFVQREIDKALPVLLMLGVMDVPDTQIEVMIERLQSSRHESLANILEIFDNLLSKTERDMIIPLFEARTTDELAALGERHFGALAQEAEKTISRYVLSRNAWQSLIALDYVLRNQPAAILPEINWQNVPTSDANRQLVSRFVQRNGAVLDLPERLFPPTYRENMMYTTLEKTIMLRGVLLFEHIPADEVFHVAQIASEKQIDAGDSLFHEGDPGTSLYIIVEGSVRIHKGDQELAVLRKGDTLGEMALFDHLPRSATATALEDTVLLEISHDQFFEVMATRLSIMQSIVRTLSLRVRAANEQVAELSAHL